MSTKYQAIDLSEVGHLTGDVLTITFPELLDLYCAAKPGKAASLRDYRLRKWRTQFDGLSARQLTPAHIAAVVSAMEKQGYSDASIYRDLADVAGCFAWAIRLRHCPTDFRNPTAEYERRPDVVRRVEVAPQWIQRLLAQSKLSSWPKLYALVLTALHSEARKGELTRLTWQDVAPDLRRGSLRDTKAGVPRRLLLTTQAVEALLAIRPSAFPEESLVFCGRNPFRPHDFRKV